MNIATIIKNLDNTIRGKELLLKNCLDSLDIAHRAAGEFLTVNLKELRAIREDLLKITS